jgi:hypothetical protein
MHVSSVAAAFGWAVIPYILYLLLTKFLTSRRAAEMARKLSCEEPPFLRNKYPFGIDHVRRLMAADRAKLFPVDAIQRTKDIGSITFRYSILGSTNVFTADEKNIQAVLATQFGDFDLGPTRSGNFWPLLGSGIFTLDGSGWEHSRAMMRPQFARNQISDLELEEQHVQRMMDALDRSTEADNSIECVDLQALFFRLTLDSATEFLFGQSVDSQIHLMPGNEGQRSQEGPDSFAFAKAFDHSQMCLANRARFMDIYWLCSPEGFKESCRIWYAFLAFFFIKPQLARDMSLVRFEVLFYLACFLSWCKL